MLFDTDVLSFRFRARRQEIAPFRIYWENKASAISEVTYAEAMEGSISGFTEATQKEYEAYLRGYILVPIDRRVTKAWAQLVARNKQRHVALGDNDAWIAATAIRHGIPLLTNDRAFRLIPELTVLPPETPDAPQPNAYQRKGRTTGPDLTEWPSDSAQTE